VSGLAPLAGGGPRRAMHLRDPLCFQWLLLRAALRTISSAYFPLSTSLHFSYSGHDLETAKMRNLLFESLFPPAFPEPTSATIGGGRTLHSAAVGRAAAAAARPQSVRTPSSTPAHAWMRTGDSLGATRLLLTSSALAYWSLPRPASLSPDCAYGDGP